MGGRGGGEGTEGDQGGNRNPQNGPIYGGVGVNSSLVRTPEDCMRRKVRAIWVSIMLSTCDIGVCSFGNKE